MAIAAAVETWGSVLSPTPGKEILEGNTLNYLPECLSHRRTSITVFFVSLFGVTSEILSHGGFMPDPGPNTKLLTPRPYFTHTMLPVPGGSQYTDLLFHTVRSSAPSESHSYHTSLQIAMQIILLQPEVAISSKEPI